MGVAGVLGPVMRLLHQAGRPEEQKLPLSCLLIWSVRVETSTMFAHAYEDDSIIAIPGAKRRSRPMRVDGPSVR